ncbi:MAG: hypothetical protein ACQESB_01740 [Elusimicrobiota bacterium]
MIKFILLFAFMFVFNTVSLLCASFSFEGVENLGMGGVGTALESPRAPLYNPALLGAREGFSMTLIDMPITLSHDIFSFYKFFNKHSDDLQEFDNLPNNKKEEILLELSDEVFQNRPRLQMGLLNPNISSGPYPIHTGARWWDLWWGFGFYNELTIDMGIDEGITVPKFDLRAQADGVFHLPLTLRTKYLPYGLPGKLHTSIAGKYLMRTKIEEKNRSVMEIEDFMEELEDKDYSPGTALGFDLGVYYDFSEKWDFAFSLKDVAGTTISFPDGEEEKISTALDLGSAYNLSKRIKLAADLRDIKIKDFSDASFFKKLHLGCELNLSRFFTLRGGFYQGYPTFGVGLGSVFNYAFHGRELGAYAGDDPFWSHSLALSIRI